MGRRRIEMYRYREVIARLRLGDTDRQIAKANLLGRPKTALLRRVAKAQGWLVLSSPLPDEATIQQALCGDAVGHKRSSSTTSHAEPWREQIRAWDARGVQGTTIHAALVRDHGFTGSYGSICRFLQHLHAAQMPDTTVRLMFAPAEAAQVDFGAGPVMLHPDGSLRRTWVFVMTLCFSRHQYLEFVWDQSVPTWLGCHRRAFEWFGGVPNRVIIDNAKCAITKASYSDPLVQRAYGECALGYGFKIDACPPREPQLKGIVESGVKYVKKNFLPLREFRDLSDLNAQAKTWALQTAGLRVHGTTKQAPLTLFALEQPTLTPLPAIAPDIGEWRQATVHRDCHVMVGKGYYSVPFRLVGQRLWLRLTDCSVAIYHEYQHLCTHPRALKAGQRVSTADHLPPNAAAFFSQDRRWCVAQAREVGPCCEDLITQLLTDQILERLRAAQHLLRLSGTYGKPRLEAACARALAHGSIFYGTVKSILRGNYDQLPLNAHIDLTVQTPYASKARFARDATSLFGAVH
jgi:transposase